MKQLEDVRPTWTNRRPVIIWSLLFIGAMIAMSIVSAVALALLAKFGFYIFTFFMTVIILGFACMIGIVGSYVFGAKWESESYFNLLKDVIPTIKKDDDANSN
jgi:hypothetical protein